MNPAVLCAPSNTCTYEKKCTRYFHGVVNNAVKNIILDLSEYCKPVEGRINCIYYKPLENVE